MIRNLYENNVLAGKSVWRGWYSKPYFMFVF